MKIYIDADGSPVTKITEEIAKEYLIDLIIVKNFAHQIESDYAEVISVDVENDSADYYITNKVKQNDIVVTQDYGLASLCLLKNASPISQNGLIFTNENIDSLLNRRYVHAKLRSQNKKHQNKKKRTSSDDDKYVKSLVLLIKNNLSL